LPSRRKFGLETTAGRRERRVSHEARPQGNPTGPDRGIQGDPEGVGGVRFCREEAAARSRRGGEGHGRIERTWKEVSPTGARAPRPDPGRYNWTVRSGKGENLGGFAVRRIACDPEQT